MRMFKILLGEGSFSGSMKSLILLTWNGPTYLPITITYTLKSDPEVNTKLRICGNSSFKTGKCITLNERIIPGPQYLNNIEDGDGEWPIKWPTPTSETVITKFGVPRRICHQEEFSWSLMEWDHKMMFGRKLVLQQFLSGHYRRLNFTASRQRLCNKIHGRQHKEMFDRINLYGQYIATF